MSSLIEQAAERLAKIREAGIELPDLSDPGGGVPVPSVASAPAEPPSVVVTPTPPLSRQVQLDLAA